MMRRRNDMNYDIAHLEIVELGLHSALVGCDGLVLHLQVTHRLVGVIQLLLCSPPRSVRLLQQCPGGRKDSIVMILNMND